MQDEKSTNDSSITNQESEYSPINYINLEGAGTQHFYVFMELDMEVFKDYNFNCTQELPINIHQLYPELTEDEIQSFPFKTLPLLSPVTWRSFLSLLQQTEQEKSANSDRFLNKNDLNEVKENKVPVIISILSCVKEKRSVGDKLIGMRCLALQSRYFFQDKV